MTAAAVTPATGLSHGRGVALMAAAALLWSIAGVVTRHLEQARGFEVTFWRSFFMLLSLLVLLPLLRGRSAFAALRRASAPVWLSGICWAGMFSAFMLALMWMPVAHVLVTMAAAPLLTALVARATIGQRIAPRTWGAIVAAGAGIVWMYGTQVTGASLPGLAVALCIPLASAINWTVVQHAQRHGVAVDLVPAVLLGAALSALATLPGALPFVASARDLALLALLGLVQLAIPCLLVVRCARVLQAPEIALLGLLEVIFGILLVWWGAGERPAPQVLLGGTLVVAALVVNELLGWKEQTR
ncbi:EamA domain-containing membrane protein RarD [Oryzisolibacter propanilivorax]|uniref:EamA domain-containing membrane protein RarD n=1 Tax=Oryzisolibacter propanilivorax TaxID=1527607 RepID=A0A1G9UN22_9BURK|nr:DMT family transporter [Oryzisolibacter propanilivorax]SDM61330.1 EamA domain-containing membrane protein RarD [Oryzisolibacter propanilivorax]